MGSEQIWPSTMCTVAATHVESLLSVPDPLRKNFPQ